MKFRVFWDAASCSLVGVDRRFEGELYVKSVYLNLFWWRGGVKFMEHCKGERKL
jgi:hypothetical protein